MQTPRRLGPVRRKIFRGQGAGRDRTRPFPGDAEVCSRRDVIRAGSWIGSQPPSPELQPIGGQYFDSGESSARKFIYY